MVRMMPPPLPRAPSRQRSPFHLVWLTNVHPQTPRGRGRAPVHYCDFRDTTASSLEVYPSEFLYVDFTGPHACFLATASAYEFLQSLVQTPEPQRSALADVILTRPHVCFCVEFDWFDAT